MDPVVASHAQLFAIQAALVSRAVEQLTEEELWRRPAPQVNSVGWILGHLTWARNALLAALGGEPEALSWADAFRRGAQDADRSAYPATEELRTRLKAINAKLKARMEAVTDAELSAPSPYPNPHPDKSLRGTLGFLSFHEGYHVGQIAYALKLLGKPGLVG